MGEKMIEEAYMLPGRIKVVEGRDNGYYEQLILDTDALLDDGSLLDRLDDGSFSSGPIRVANSGE